MTEQEQKLSALNGTLTGGIVGSSYKEASLLEQIDMEIEHQKLRLANLQEKRKMLQQDPSLEAKIQFFNRY